jgi:peroxiredoxin
MRFLPLAAAFTVLAAPLAADAALNVGVQAPDFTTKGAIGGKQFDLNLKQKLKEGYVVLYFFPAAFTPGCTMEANAFAEATDEFQKAGATVIGMSADPIDKLADFSVKECRDKFAVATASPAVIKAYDVAIKPTADMPPKVQEMLAGKTSRTSYVIAPSGRVIYAFDHMDWRDHVKNTLEAVKKAKRG